jgi:hypothetical protein
LKCISEKRKGQTLKKQWSHIDCVVFFLWFVGCKFPNPRLVWSASMMSKRIMWRIPKFSNFHNRSKSLCDVNVFWGMSVSNVACGVYWGGGGEGGFYVFVLCIFVWIFTWCYVSVFDKGPCAISLWLKLNPTCMGCPGVS